ncbi:Poly(ADP-ribose) polymerase and DNA-Ligase Zn-finger region [Leishmania shawi]|uniref:Poly(ADP-ribose) polymerase and DNA-Ligase Zn-finger region n=3 Tax=Viannia TaxID=37616 RepID=A0AAW3B6C3_9TRYP
MYMRRIHTVAPQGVVNKIESTAKARKETMPRLCVEYSKSGRAKCSNTSCGKKIEKHELRIGTEVIMQFRDEEIESWKWRHLCCFTERQLSNAKETGDINAIQGEDDLAPADKALLQEMREGRLVGDTSILGRIGDVTHSPVADELKGKGGKVAKSKAKASLSADNRGSPSATAGEKRPRLPLRKANMANATTKDDDADSEATDEYEVAVETVTGNLKCPYGANCFRTNQEHFRQYTHGDENGTAADAAVPSDHSGAKLKPVIKRKKT